MPSTLIPDEPLQLGYLSWVLTCLSSLPRWIKASDSHLASPSSVSRVVSRTEVVYPKPLLKEEPVFCSVRIWIFPWMDCLHNLTGLLFHCLTTLTVKIFLLYQVGNFQCCSLCPPQHFLPPHLTGKSVAAFALHPPMKQLQAAVRSPPSPHKDVQIQFLEVAGQRLRLITSATPSYANPTPESGPIKLSVGK